MTGDGDRLRACGSCGAPLAAGQRYCVQCGERVAAHSPLLRSLLRRRGPRSPRASAAPRAGEPLGGALGAPARAALSPAARFERVLGALTLPGARTFALLVAGFLCFGVAIGDVAATRPRYALSAAARRPIKLVVAPGPGGAREANTATGATQPPAASAQPTPEASQSSARTAESARSQSSKSSSGGANAAGEGSSSGSRSSGSEGSGGASGSNGSSGSPASKLPAVKHVFVIMLSDEPFASTFGPSSPAPYISHTLEHEGELLVRYYGVASGALANGIALMSGQGPTPQTLAGCPTFANVSPAGSAAEEQVTGEGCVYPSATKTLFGQLASKHLSARAYVQGMDEPGSAGGACAHPAQGAADPTAQPSSGSPYATASNPVVYFHAIIDSASCAREDVGLSALAHDLADAARTPAFSYIAPGPCDDGSPSPCAPGAAAGLPPAEALLKRVVREILASKAYRSNGLLVITVDSAPSSGELADSSSCCAQPRFPNLPPATGKAALLPPEGGGQVGAILLSPFVKAGSVSQETFNHFSLLRTVEDLFGVPHLGYAALAKLSAFEPALFLAR